MVELLEGFRSWYLWGLCFDSSIWMEVSGMWVVVRGKLVWKLRLGKIKDYDYGIMTEEGDWSTHNKPTTQGR